MKGETDQSDHSAAVVAEGYGFVEFATLAFTDERRFALAVRDERVAALDHAVYLWSIDDKIVRVGSTKGSLLLRSRQTENWLNGLISGKATRKSAERLQRDRADAENWQRGLQGANEAVARCFGRSGTVVETPMGQVNAYLAEENWLIERFRPELNRSKFR